MDFDWKTRVQKRLDALELDMKAASRQAGQNETWVRDLLKRERKPNIDSFVTLAHVLKVTPSWLLTGEGDDDGFGASVVQLVGFVGANPSGEILYADGQGTGDFVPVPPGGSPEDKALEVKGHSMRGYADDGSLIYYSGEQPVGDAYLGEVVVCGVDTGEVLVKKLLRGSERNLYDLESINGETRRDARLLWIAEITAVIPPRQARRLLKREAVS